MNLIEITDYIGVKLEDIGHYKVVPRVLMQSVNSIQSRIRQKIADLDMALITATATLTPSTSGVDLPVDFLRCLDLSSGDPAVPVDIVLPRQRFNYENTAWDIVGGSSGLRYAYFSGKQMVFSAAVTANCSLIYCRRLPKLHRALAKAAGTASITLNENTMMGSLELTDDYYNNATIAIVSGTGRGQERMVSDYDADTQVATLSSNWSTIPDQSSIYEIKCELPESPDFHTLLCDIVAHEFSKKTDPEKTKELRTTLYSYLGQLNTRNQQNPYELL